jgi:Nif-specific regulatory protein
MRESTDSRHVVKLRAPLSDDARRAMAENHDTFIATVGDWIRKEVSADLLLQRMVDAIAVELDADRGTIFLVDPAQGELVSVAAHLPELEEIRLRIGDGIAGAVAESGRPEVVPDVEADDRFRADFDRKTGYRTSSIVAAPLVADSGNLLGVVQLLNKRSGRFGRGDVARLGAIARRAGELLEHTTIPAESLTEEVEHEDHFGIDGRFNGIVTESEAMRRVLRDVRRVAATDATVLLRGESGTGKGVLARAIHHSSDRSAAPFVAIDCTTLPEGLMENELFGHTRGAYTGAATAAAGRVAAAEGGTLFLDEVGDLPPALQGKLLTLLQDRRYTPIGGAEAVEADVRVVAATHRPLEDLVREGSFREDLYYRLRVVELALPPLRERGADDIARLARFFVQKSARRYKKEAPSLAPEALEVLTSHRWPGNVRELENCIESAVIFADDAIRASDLSFPRRSTRPDVRAVPAAGPFDDEPTLEELERRYILHLLDQHDGNRSQVARVMDIGRTTLFRKMKTYDID